VKVLGVELLAVKVTALFAFLSTHSKRRGSGCTSLVVPFCMLSIAIEICELIICLKVNTPLLSPLSTPPLEEVLK
jgi:hypothetical protein